MSDLPPPRGFPEAEFAGRTARAQAQMADQGIDALLLMTEPEVRYFTGFLTAFWQSPARPWFVVVPAEGKPLAVIPEIGAQLMRQTWVEDIRTWSAPAPSDDGISLLHEVLAPIAARGGRIGVLKGPESVLRMPLGDYERLMAGLPGLEIVDATPLIRSLRMVKSPAEIAKIAHICGIASRSFASLPEIAVAGTPLVEVFRQFRRLALANGADDVPYLVGAADQGGYRDVISPPSEDPLRHGDVLMLDTGCVWDGYFCDFDRNVAIGGASEAAKRAYETLWQATEAGLAAARPGATCSDVHRAMTDVIGQGGGPSSGDVGRLGHGLGMQLTEWPSFMPSDDTVLTENMVLTLEPSMTVTEGRMMVHEENILVCDGLARLLTERSPDQLPIL